jgi:glycosyltransferase involved in cell wall biosynthesis
MHLLAFGTYNSAAHPRIAVLIEGLIRRGHRVDECNVPLGLSTADRVSMLRQPWRAVGLGLRLLRSWVRLVGKAFQYSRPDAVLVGYMAHFDVHLARVLFPRSPIVLDHLIGASDTARDRGEAGGLKLAALSTIDRAALGAADLVIVDTEEHRQTLPSRLRAGEKGVVVAVGAENAWFAAGDAKRARGGAPPSGRRALRAVFFGLFTPLQGATVIADAIALLRTADIEFTMIGDGQDRRAAVAATRGSSSVQWVDWVPAPNLPILVAEHDVCLGIFGTTAKARRVVPNKVFQGAAAGCVVVTSDTVPQRRILGDAAVFVPPGDAAELARVLRELAADLVAVSVQAEKARQHARQYFRSDVVVQPLIDRLTAAAAQQSRRWFP